MPLSIKTKQVAGVTLLVGLVVIALSGWYLSSIARVLLEQNLGRARLMVELAAERIKDLTLIAGDPHASIQADQALVSMLASIQSAPAVTYASIVDTRGVIVVDGDPARVGTQLSNPNMPKLEALLEAGPIEQLQAFRSPLGRTYETSAPLFLDGVDIGGIHVAVSTLLIQSQFEATFRRTLVTAAIIVGAAMLLAMLLSQIVLRPIHVIRSGLARLGRGELDVKVDLPADSALGDLGESFKAVTARLAADRTELAEQRALESVVDHLEDAVALVSTDGTLLFVNTAMRRVLGAERGAVSELLPSAHPYRVAIESSLQTLKATAPRVVEITGGGDRLVLTDVVSDAEARPIGVLLVARNLAYLTQVESTLSYSRKLAALSRLTAGIAHEIKNPLNAAMIHLELLRMRVADSPEALENLAIIARQVRRLDEVVQGFLKFTRPEDLALKPVPIAPLVDELMPVVLAEAEKHRIDVRVDISPDLPPASADAGLLQQAFLNLALNACQAMPKGGRLRIAARPLSGRRLEVLFEDTGIGITPDDLKRIFDLYFTTKEHGSGIGLSLVYRTVQLHDGEIEVQSTPGSGTTFRIVLRQASENLPTAA